MSVGVNLVGYLDAEVGTGEAARLVATGLSAAGVPYAAIGEVATASRRRHPFPVVAPGDADHPINLLCLNADMLPAFAARVGPGFFAGRRTVGLWFWEVGAVPPGLLRAFDHVDEVWVASHHVADAFAPVAPKPVIHMPLPVAVLGAPKAGPPDGWPVGPTILFVFDHLSVFERKNPLGVVEAFCRAFPRPAGPTLVIKSINGDQAPAEHARLVAATAARPDVVVWDGYVDAATMQAMTAACVAYVSLHRAEGLGLTIAQAMAHGRPVIATGATGSLEYTSPFNSYLVDHRTVRIGDSAPPYPADGTWAEPDLDDAARLMRRVIEEPDEAARRGARGRDDLRRTHAPAVAGAAMRRRLELLARDVPVATPGWRQRIRALSSRR
jgi:glycosyltransferase involved in cell wall biosynthesis